MLLALPAVLGVSEAPAAALVPLASAGNSTVVKVGQDAERIGCVDIWWTADGAIRSAVALLPATEFEKDETAQAFVKDKHDFLNEMMQTPIAKVDNKMSSKKVRFEPSGVASFLLTLVSAPLPASASASDEPAGAGGDNSSSDTALLDAKQMRRFADKTFHHLIRFVTPENEALYAGSVPVVSSGSATPYASTDASSSPVSSLYPTQIGRAHV